MSSGRVPAGPREIYIPVWEVHLLGGRVVSRTMSRGVFTPHGYIRAMKTHSIIVCILDERPRAS